MSLLLLLPTTSAASSLTTQQDATIAALTSRLLVDYDITLAYAQQLAWTLVDARYAHAVRARARARPVPV